MTACAVPAGSRPATLGAGGPDLPAGAFPGALGAGGPGLRAGAFPGALGAGSPDLPVGAFPGAPGAGGPVGAGAPPGALPGVLSGAFPGAFGAALRSAGRGAVLSWAAIPPCRPGATIAVAVASPARWSPAPRRAGVRERALCAPGPTTSVSRGA